MTSMSQVRQLAEVGTHYAGFIFYEHSPRYVGNKILAAELKPFSALQKVGVFVNENREKILQTIVSYGLNAVQLHGDETPEFCQSLKAEATVIKAFRINGNELHFAELWKFYQDAADYFLFDTKSEGYGGSGQKFDWQVLETNVPPIPYFLSGGIGAQELELLRRFMASNTLFALDINSRFETQPGIKDMNAVAQFIHSFAAIKSRHKAGSDEVSISKKITNE